MRISAAPDNYHQICSFCGRIRGEHTGREWRSHSNHKGKKVRNVFSNDEIEFVVKHWDSEITMLEIGNILNRSYGEIYRLGKMMMLGPKKKPNNNTKKQRHFTSDEDEYIRKHWDTLTVAQMAIHLKRHDGSIVCRGHRIGLGPKTIIKGEK